MNSIKTFTLTLVAAGTLMAANSGLAQPNRMQHRHNSSQQIAKLHLTQQQKTELHHVRRREQHAIHQIRANKKMRGKEKWVKIHAVKRETTARIKQILTPDQFAQWQKNQQRHRSEHRKHNHHSQKPGN